MESFTLLSGELIFYIFSALAQFERRLIQERTKAGLACARARPPLISTKTRCELSVNCTTITR